MLEHYVPTQRQEQKLGHPKLKGDPPLGLGRQCEGQEAEEARPDCGQVMSCGAAKVAGPSLGPRPQVCLRGEPGPYLCGRSAPGRGGSHISVLPSSCVYLSAPSVYLMVCIFKNYFQLW